jgi:aminoglycoside 3-N-acetyltransferase
VREHDTLFVHSGLRSALRVAGDSAREKLVTVLDGWMGTVPQGNLIVPTFTYSFCNGAEYDVDRTPSTVGALTDYFRQLPEVRRTADPIFSSAVHGALAGEWERRLFEVGDKDCFGDESVFALLAEVNAKLLFFGVGFEYCTFVHHVEQRLGVPYRYMKDFTGTVKTRERAARVTAHYFVRDLDSDVEPFLIPLADSLLARGRAARASLPDGPSLLVTDAESTRVVAEEELSSNPSFLLERGHPAPSA